MPAGKMSDFSVSDSTALVPVQVEVAEPTEGIAGGIAKKIAQGASNVMASASEALKGAKGAAKEAAEKVAERVQESVPLGKKMKTEEEMGVSWVMKYVMEESEEIRKSRAEVTKMFDRLLDSLTEAAEHQKKLSTLLENTCEMIQSSIEENRRRYLAKNWWEWGRDIVALVLLGIIGLRVGHLVHQKTLPLPNQLPYHTQTSFPNLPLSS